MDDLIEVRKEVTTIGSSKEPKQVIYWPISQQAKNAAELMDRAWLYQDDLYGLNKMGFRIIVNQAAVAPGATISVIAP